MEFDITEEQEILKKMARDFLANEFPKTLVREMEEDPSGFSLEVWEKMADLGWMGLIIPEEFGGSGGSFIDLLILMEEIGRGCLVSPFFSSVLCTSIILDVGIEKQKREFLPRIAGGEKIFALALTEESATYNASGIITEATVDKNAYIINGRKLFVHDAHIADYFVCITRTSHMSFPENSISIFIVDSKSPGISISPMPTIAADKQDEIIFKDVNVPEGNMLGELNGGWAAVERLIYWAATVKCAEMLGGADWTVENCVDYVKIREQFGKPIGTFGIIQHYLAEMWAEISLTRRLVYYAGWLIEQGLPYVREAAMAKARMSDVYKRCTRRGVQVFGGIGTTREHDMGLYFRRARQALPLFGDPEFCRERVAEDIGL